MFNATLNFIASSGSITATFLSSTRRSASSLASTSALASSCAFAKGRID
jgi:hypothetical protein